jgi:hypothetical protein
MEADTIRAQELPISSRRPSLQEAAVEPLATSTKMATILSAVFVAAQKKKTVYVAGLLRESASARSHGSWGRGVGWAQSIFVFKKRLNQKRNPKLKTKLNLRSRIFQPTRPAREGRDWD